VEAAVELRDSEPPGRPKPRSSMYLSRDLPSTFFSFVER
jgi:hypothetical protein